VYTQKFQSAASGLNPTTEQEGAETWALDPSIHWVIVGHGNSRDLSLPFQQMRFVYPHVVDMAYASSAPFIAYSVMAVANNSNAKCYQKTWQGFYRTTTLLVEISHYVKDIEIGEKTLRLCTRILAKVGANALMY